jgi:tetratricopeptide (TPR) repeat protein
MARQTKARELKPDLYERVTALCERGNEAFEVDRYVEAIEEYEKALALIPQPLEEWEAATWVLTALGDCHYLLADYSEALRYLVRAVRSPGGLGNPFVHLRLGEVQYELGNQDRAKDELARAYMGGGPEIFEGEEPKYLTFLRRFMIGI